MCSIVACVEVILSFCFLLYSHAVFERLLDVIFGDDTHSQSSIVYGLEIVLALLGIAKKPTKPNS